MSMWRRKARSWVERLTGHDVIRFGQGSIAFVRRSDRDVAWFSYRSQLKHLLAKTGVDLVLDVGANEGQYAGGLRGDFTGEIISFEPVASAFGRLSTAAASAPPWRVHNMALGSRAGTGLMHVSKETKFSSLHAQTPLSGERFRDAPATVADEVVPIRRLDDVLDEAPELAGRRIFLKMDTQGHDLEVFSGAGRWLDNIVLLQSELSVLPLYDGIEHWTSCLARYEEAGFGVAGMFPICRDGSNRVIEYDCLMVRSGATRTA
jgi:FkbM family methyltransferase